MDFLTVEQVWAVVMFVLGSIILNTCSKWEKKDRADLKEAKHYGRGDSNLLKPRNLRGTIMTLVGTGLCLGSMIVFMLHLDIKKVDEVKPPPSIDQFFK
tara:strand:- start:138 stop:434 length:297 start_codon:yes stop_codon:yes gene_type:complete